MNYIRLSEIVKSKGCALVWSETDFKEKYKNYEKTNIEIISSCGHNTIVQVSNLIYKNTGIICKKCGYKKQSEESKNVKKDNSITEYQSIKAIESYCKNTFKFNIFVEGTLADFAIRPVNEKTDSWLPIQIKSKKSLSHGIYSFDIKNTYKDMYVLLFCIDDQRIWLLNGNDIHIKRINIGQYNSIYSKYEIELCNLSETLLNKYENDNNNFKKPLIELNIPISLQAQQEQEFKQYRESLFTNLKFNYPEINNRVFDCVINDVFKVQDKVITSQYQKKTNNKDERRSNKSYIVNLCKRNFNGNIMYELGDNDFYWLSLPDKKGAYLIPENILFENGVVSKKGENVKFSTLTLYPDHTKEKLENIKSGWLNDYLYFYNKDIEKITNLFLHNHNCKKPVIINDFIPLNLYDKKKNQNAAKPIIKKQEDPSSLIKTLVSQIFKNVIKNNKNIITVKLKQIIKKQEDPSSLIKNLVSQIFKNVIENNINKSKPTKIYECIDCKKQLNKSGITRCLECSRLNSRKVERPSYIQLQKDLEETNYVQVGKKYGVSDNCVRKWIKYFEKSEDTK